MRDIKSIIAERAREEPSVAAQHWENIMEQFDTVRAKLFEPRYYCVTFLCNSSIELSLMSDRMQDISQDHEQFREARAYDTLMCTGVSQHAAEEMQLPSIPVMDIVTPPRQAPERGRKARDLLPA